MRALFASLAAFAAAATFVSAAEAVPLVVSDGTSLTQVDSAAPDQPGDPKAITGLQPGEKIVDIDVRPADRLLYGVGSSSVLYRIDPNTGAAVPIGSPGTFALAGAAFGVDINPSADVVRVVSDQEQNLRLNPDTASAVVDSPLTPAVAVVANAYTNPISGPVVTTLFDLDSESGQLMRQGGVDGAPPSANSGQLTAIGSLGLGGNLNPAIGFDIAPEGSAFATITTDATRLYTIDLASGAATAVGTVGDGRTALNGLAVGRDVVGFPSRTASATEGESVTLSVTRDEPGFGAISVDYAIAPGSASESDYTPATGTVSWAAGDITAKTIVVPITDDAAEEGAESFAVALSNPTGGATVGAGAKATVTIAASDPGPPTLKLGGKRKQKLRTVKRKGLAITATVSRTCDLSGSLRLGKKRIGEVRFSLAEGKTKLRVKAKKKFRRRLRARQKLTVKATCADVNGKSNTGRRTVTLKRR